MDESMEFLSLLTNISKSLSRQHLFHAAMSYFYACKWMASSA
jgi:hypothetical protein